MLAVVDRLSCREVLKGLRIGDRGRRLVLQGQVLDARFEREAVLREYRVDATGIAVGFNRMVAGLQSVAIGATTSGEGIDARRSRRERIGARSADRFFDVC